MALSILCSNYTPTTPISLIGISCRVMARPPLQNLIVLLEKSYSVGSKLFNQTVPTMI